MTSLLKSFPSLPYAPTKFYDILTGSYDDSYVIDANTVSMPIPYTVANQTLDINTNIDADSQKNNDILDYVNNGLAPNTGITFQGRLTGGSSLIFSLGPNMTTWLRNRINDIEAIGSPFEGNLNLYIQPVMTKVQMVAQRQGDSPLNDESVYGVTTEAPTSTDYIGGDNLNNFFSTWIFKSPMTVQYTYNGITKYITLTSQISAN